MLPVTVRPVYLVVIYSILDCLQVIATSDSDWQPPQQTSSFLNPPIGCPKLPTGIRVQRRRPPPCSRVGMRLPWHHATCKYVPSPRAPARTNKKDDNKQWPHIGHARQVTVESGYSQLRKALLEKGGVGMVRCGDGAKDSIATTKGGQSKTSSSLGVGNY